MSFGVPLTLGSGFGIRIKMEKIRVQDLDLPNNSCGSETLMVGFKTTGSEREWRTLLVCWFTCIRFLSSHKLERVPVPPSLNFLSGKKTSAAWYDVKFCAVSVPSKLYMFWILLNADPDPYILVLLIGFSNYIFCISITMYGTQILHTFLFIK